jgi:hypothetical protein
MPRKLEPQSFGAGSERHWIPAFAGTTGLGEAVGKDVREVEIEIEIDATFPSFPRKREPRAFDVADDGGPRPTLLGASDGRALPREQR